MGGTEYSFKKYRQIAPERNLKDRLQIKCLTVYTWFRLYSGRREAQSQKGNTQFYRFPTKSIEHMDGTEYSFKKYRQIAPERNLKDRLQIQCLTVYTWFRLYSGPHNTTSRRGRQWNVGFGTIAVYLFTTCVFSDYDFREGG